MVYKKKGIARKNMKEWILEGLFCGLGFLPIELLLILLWKLFVG